jgi:hypothetical protein
MGRQLLCSSGPAFPPTFPTDCDSTRVALILLERIERGSVQVIPNGTFNGSEGAFREIKLAARSF